MSQFTFFPAPSGTGYAQLYDDDSPTPNPIGTPVAIPAGTTVDVTAPHGTVKTTDGTSPVMDVLSGGSANLPQIIFRYKDAFDVQQDSGSFDTLYAAPHMRPDFIFPRAELKDSNDDGIGLYATVVDVALDTVPPIPDSAITLPNGAVVNVKATQPYTVPRTDELEWVFAAGDGGSATITVDARYADDYDVFTDDGSSGTVEIKINSGSWAAPSGVVTLAIGDTLEARRSVWSAQGWLMMERVISV